MSRTEQIISVIAVCLLLIVQIFFAATVPVQAPAVAQAPLGGIGVRDVGTPGLMTSTPAATSTIAPTPTALSSTIGGSGAMKYGYIASYTSGTNVNHGLGRAPVACFFQFVNASAITVTAVASTTAVFSATTSATSPMFWGCGF